MTAEVQLLSAPLSLSGTERLVSVLAQAYAEGIELGPREPHIRAVSLSLQTLVRQLRAECEALRPLLAATGQPDLTAAPGIVELIAAVEGLVALACPNPGSVGAGSLPLSI